MLNTSRRNIKNIKVTAFFLFLSLALIFSLVNIGIPLIVRMSSLILSLKKPDKNDQTLELLTPPVIFTQYESTNSASVTIDGRSFLDGKTIFFRDGSEVERVELSKNEAFTIGIVLNEGLNSIYAVSENPNGKSSLPSSTLIITYDNQPPELEINFPAENTNFSGKNQKIISLEGKTDPESQLYVAGHLVILDKDGKFSYQISLNEGANKIKIEAFDKAGNKTEKEISVFYAP